MLSLRSRLVALAPSARHLKTVKGVGSSPFTVEWSPGSQEERETSDIVRDMLESIQHGGDAACLEYARSLDNWQRNTCLLTPEEVAEQIAEIHPQVKDDIDRQQDRVFKFADALKRNMHEFEMEVSPGVLLGTKIIPVNTAGCYVPGGRFSHVSSATMTIVTAKAAGVPNVVATSPPMAGTERIHPGTLYAMQQAGADHILCMGGVQAIGALAYGCFTGAQADVIVGPGNKFVAQAKRQLFGRVGIDMFAGPTEVMILADHSSDPWLVANDLVGQAEHGTNSPAWLITTDEELGRKVCELTPPLCEKLGTSSAASEAWENYGEVIVVDTNEEMARLSDHYAPEHLQVMTEPDTLDWWLANLTNYGSLFLGEETHTTYGDKYSGTNHVLPTKGVAKYSGGLSVDKFLKKVTYQRMDIESNREVGLLSSRISRLEGMEGHARSCDVRLDKYFPDEEFDLEVKWTQ